VLPYQCRYGLGWDQANVRSAHRGLFSLVRFGAEPGRYGRDLKGGLQMINKLTNTFDNNLHAFFFLLALCLHDSK